MQFVYFLATVFALFGVSFGQVAFTSAATLTINENVAAGTTVMTVAATTSGTTPITFALSAQNPVSLFAVASGGAVTVATGQTIDAETSQTSTLTVVGTDSTPTTALSATATITITVTDLNDHTPVPSTTTTATLAASAAAGTAVGTFAATDGDQSAPNNAITYTIPCTTTYSVASSTGALTVATGVTIPATRCDSIIITAKDGASGADQLSASSTISITIGSDTCTTFTDVCPSGSASLALSLMTMMLGLLTNLMK